MSVITAPDPYRGMTPTEIPHEVDEFAASLERALSEAAARAEKASAVVQKAEDDYARASERLHAIRAAAEAFKEASQQRLARKSDIVESDPQTDVLARDEARRYSEYMRTQPDLGE